MGCRCGRRSLAVVVGLGLLPAYANTLACAAGCSAGGMGFLSAMTSYVLAACLSYRDCSSKVSFARVAPLIQSSEQAQRVQLALLL